VETRYIDELGVELVGFNSCEHATDDDYPGSIGPAQQAFAEERIRDGDHFRIAVMHHHLVPPQGQVQRDLSVMTNGSGVRAWLVKKRFELVLHGHQHVDWRNVYREDGDWFQSIVGGASAGVGRYGRDKWELRLGYHLLRIRGCEGERVRRHYSLQDRGWTNGSGGDASIELRFGRPPAVAVPGRLTKADLRRVLEAIRTDGDFEGFVIVFFADLHRQMGRGMNRTEKINELLLRTEEAELEAALRTAGLLS
jgi:hypothetical protein